MLIIQAVFPKWKKRSSLHKMDSEQAAQQIQALIASVEELTRQNEELQKAAESQNGNDSGLLRTRTKKNIEESKETAMRKN